MTLDYVKLIDEHFASLVKQDQADKGGGPIRGSASGHCLRKLAAKLEGLEQKAVTPRSKRIFSLGEDRDVRLTDALRSRISSQGYHCWVQRETWTPLPPAGNTTDLNLDAQVIERYLQRYGGVGLTNQPTDTTASLKRTGNRLWMRSRIDFMWDNPGEGLTIIEVKTMSSFAFEKVQRGGEAELSADYRMQLIMQWLGIQQEGYHCGTPGWLIENKDTSELLYIPLVMTEQDWTNSNNRLMDLRALLRRWAQGQPIELSPTLLGDSMAGGGTLPWQCNYCDIGPETGRCCPGLTLTNTAKKGDIPKWKASPSPSSEPA